MTMPLPSDEAMIIPGWVVVVAVGGGGGRVVVSRRVSLEILLLFNVRMNIMVQRW